MGLTEGVKDDDEDEEVGVKTVGVWLVNSDDIIDSKIKSIERWASKMMKKMGNDDQDDQDEKRYWSTYVMVY